MDVFSYKKIKNRKNKHLRVHRKKQKPTKNPTTLSERQNETH